MVYAQPRLPIELVPRALWGRNLSRNVPARAWSKTREYLLDRCYGYCEVCYDGPLAGRNLICHEQWQYSIEDGGHWQRLTGLVMICRLCNSVIHFGRTCAVLGTEHIKNAYAHLQRVNEWPREETRAYFEHIRRITAGCDEVETWVQDITWYLVWYEKMFDDRFRSRRLERELYLSPQSVDILRSWL